jgi:N-acetylneuraminate lyase
MAAAKATMGMLGLDVGGPRLPNAALSAEQARTLRSDLERFGFFERVRG